MKHKPSLLRISALSFLTVLLLAIPTVTLILCSVAFPNLLEKTVTVTLPDLVGETVDSILLPDSQLLQTTILYRYDDTPDGTVLAQSPPPGTVRTAIPGKRYVTLTLTVSRGKRTEAVPTLCGLSAEAGEAALISCGFSTEITEVYSQRQRGEILSQSPLPGTLYPVGQAVSLTVSRGPLVPTVSVPLCTGHSEIEARGLLDAAGLLPGRVTYRYSALPKGRVIAQTPLPGAKIPEEGRVVLYVSLGEPSAESEAETEQPPLSPFTRFPYPMPETTPQP